MLTDIRALADHFLIVLPNINRVLLVAEEEMVLVVSVLLEKREKIPPGSVTLEEEKVLLFSGTSLGF